MNPYQRDLINLRKSYAITMGRLIDAQEEVARLTDLVVEQQRTITALLPPGETSTAWAVHLARLEGRVDRLLALLKRVHNIAKEGEDASLYGAVETELREGFPK